MTVSKNKFIIFLQILMFSFVSISAVFAQDIDKVKSILHDISSEEYGNEDQEFINALSDIISGGDFIEIDDLLNTYIDLKENI